MFRKKKKTNIIKRYCLVCDMTIYGITAFCTKECEEEWRKNHKDYKSNEHCAYQGCFSGLAPILGSYYCSIFCYTEQNIINKKKTEEEIKRINQFLKDIEDATSKLKSRLFEIKIFDDNDLLQRIEYIDMMKDNEISRTVDLIIEEVAALKYDCPTYNGPIGQASDLFGSVSYDSTSTNSFSSK